MHAGQASQHCVDQRRLHGAADAGTEDARGADQGLRLVLTKLLLCVVPAMLLMLLMLPVLRPMLSMVVICMPAAMAALLLRVRAAFGATVAALLLVVVATHGRRRLRLLCDEGARRTPADRSMHAAAGVCSMALKLAAPV